MKFEFLNDFIDVSHLNYISDCGTVDKVNPQHLRLVMCGPGLKAFKPAKPGPKSLARVKPGSGLKAGLRV
ncbi:uncharacterized protein PHACADRAFT_203243 [Phanerochaete carnosa HHB-10118-sp]|uniref:Uncharacterized protein n=1 Tax=Phanerochaete carnosa (strain HHB-10118-sp) TaxID=650164 RepID=K5VND3_PHACS|nr:uncharacterized protein PHACADRAFT_203243 [Phanerochaete carnosa HHB-10118-sp]EKM48109.1 hypothetical protein PHACADRAFT_203243 [Phanerochaete carnosa HHB-10118-sp]